MNCSTGGFRMVWRPALCLSNASAFNAISAECFDLQTFACRPAGWQGGRSCPPLPDSAHAGENGDRHWSVLLDSSRWSPVCLPLQC